MTLQTEATDVMNSTTNMMNDAEILKVTLDSMTSIDTALSNESTVSVSQDIKDFLKKPILITQGTWSTSDAQFSILDTNQFPASYLVSDVGRKKLAGFLGFRGKLVVRLQVNAMKHQAGRLCLCFLPMSGVDGVYTGMRSAFAQIFTQLPRVELDAASQSEVIFETPHITPYNYFDLTANLLPTGSTLLFVYLPLATGTGTTTCEWTIWAHYEDVELVTPTYNAQASFRGRNSTDAESSKPLSAALGSLQTVARTAKDIPLLSSLGGVADWVLGSIKNVAKYFGYSKPLIYDQIARVTQNPVPFMAVADGGSVAYPTGMAVSNKVDILPGFAGVDIDETSITHICSIPAYADGFSINTSTGAQAVVYSKSVEPTAWVVYDKDSVSGLYYAVCQPLGYIGSMFTWYKGGIKITIKAASTQFHSARLLLSFQPGEATLATLDETSYTLREIIDLREKTEWTFCLPYASVYPWRKTNPFGGTSTDPPVSLAEAYGQMQIILLNPLQAPDTVSSTVNFVMEVSGAEDIEFALPVEAIAAPWISTYSAQMDTDKMSSSVVPCKTIGNATTTADKVAAARFCMGEQVTSVLQLLKRMSPVAFTGDTTTWTAMQWNPFFPGAMATNSTPALVQGIPVLDYYSLIVSCYLLSRGGVRIGIQNNATGTNFPLRMQLVSNYKQGINFEPPTNYSGNPQLGLGSRNFTDTLHNPYSEYEIPQYTQSHSRMNALYSDTFPIAAQPHYSNVRLNLRVNGTGMGYAIYRGVSDDFQLGYWIGCPIVLTYAGSAGAKAAWPALPVS